MNTPSRAALTQLLESVPPTELVSRMLRGLDQDAMARVNAYLIVTWRALDTCQQLGVSPAAINEFVAKWASKNGAPTQTVKQSWSPARWCNPPCDDRTCPWCK